MIYFTDRALFLVYLYLIKDGVHFLFIPNFERMLREAPDIGVPKNLKIMIDSITYVFYNSHIMLARNILTKNIKKEAFNNLHILSTVVHSLLNTINPYQYSRLIIGIEM